MSFHVVAGGLGCRKIMKACGCHSLVIIEYDELPSFVDHPFLEPQPLKTASEC